MTQLEWLSRGGGISPDCSHRHHLRNSRFVDLSNLGSAWAPRLYIYNKRIIQVGVSDRFIRLIAYVETYIADGPIPTDVLLNLALHLV
jgi:hypothetical protein